MENLIRCLNELRKTPMTNTDQKSPSTLPDMSTSLSNDAMAVTLSPIVANVGRFQTFNAFLDSYQRVVGNLFEPIESGREAANIIAPPLLFLMRH